MASARKLGGQHISWFELLKCQAIITDIDRHSISSREITIQKANCQWVLKLSLDCPLERTRPISGIEAPFGQEFLSKIADLQPLTTIVEQCVNAIDLDV